MQCMCYIIMAPLHDMSHQNSVTFSSVLGDNVFSLLEVSAFHSFLVRFEKLRKVKVKVN